MNGELKVICGCTGSGKTSIAMKEFDPVKSGLVYDFQNHWGKLVFYDEKGEKIEKPGCKLIRSHTELSKLRLRVSPENFDINSFIHIVKHLRGFTMVIEEATGLFPNGIISQDLIKLVLSKRHSKNDFIFVFHALNRIPPQFIEFINELYLFNTYDLWRNVRSKFPKIYDDWRRIQANAVTNKYYFEKLTPPLS